MRRCRLVGDDSSRWGIDDGQLGHRRHRQDFGHAGRWNRYDVNSASLISDLVGHRHARDRGIALSNDSISA